MSLPGRCNLGARHVPGHRDDYGDDDGDDVDDDDGDDDSDNDDYDGAGVVAVDDDDNWKLESIVQTSDPSTGLSGLCAMCNGLAPTPP